MQWNGKNTQFVFKNVENNDIFVEGFWPDFYACERFMKYSMSGDDKCYNKSNIQLDSKCDKYSNSDSRFYSECDSNNDGRYEPPALWSIYTDIIKYVDNVDLVCLLFIYKAACVVSM